MYIDIHIYLGTKMINFYYYSKVQDQPRMIGFDTWTRSVIAIGGNLDFGFYSGR